jgi:hypothetical protein
MEDSLAARKIYMLFSSQHVAVAIIDTSMFFTDCRINRLGERSVRLVSSSANINNTEYHRVFVYVSPKGCNRYMIDIFAERTHGICSFELKRVKEKFHLVQKRYGFTD